MTVRPQDLFLSMLIVLFLSVSIPTYAQLNDFENVEEITKKGFFKQYFGELFTGFTNYGEPLNISGNVGLQLRSYHASGGENRQDPFFYSLNANANTRIYGINVPFSLLITAKNTTSSLPSLSELKNAFSDDFTSRRDRLIRFGFSPEYKWIKFHFGHRIMNFSQFSVSNLNFYGTGMELTPGNLRISALRGRIANAEPIDLSLTEPNFPRYQRNGWGLKLGYGSREEFIDFILFKAEDDLSSLTDQEGNLETIVPEENAIVGFNGKKTILKRVTVNVDYAYSIFSPNALDALSATARSFDFLMDNTTTTQYNSAFEIGSNYEGKRFNLGFKVRRIDTDFQSFGSYFFNNDIMEYIGNFQSRLSENINVSLNFGTQTNNLDLSKQSTTQRIVYGLNANYSKNNFNANIDFSNNATDVGYVLNNNLDSLSFVLILQNAGINLTYSINSDGGNSHSINLNSNIQRVSDDIDDPLNSDNSRLISSTLSHGYFIPDHGFRFNTRLIFNKNRVNLNSDINRYGLGLGMTKSFWKDKLNLGIDINYFINTMTNVERTSNFRNSVNIQYKISNGFNAQMNWSYLSSNVNQMGRLDELIGLFGVQYNFLMRPFKKSQESN